MRVGCVEVGECIVEMEEGRGRGGTHVMMAVGG